MSSSFFDTYKITKLKNLTDGIKAEQIFRTSSRRVIKRTSQQSVIIMSCGYLRSKRNRRRSSINKLNFSTEGDGINILTVNCSQEHQANGKYCMNSLIYVYAVLFQAKAGNDWLNTIQIVDSASRSRHLFIICCYVRKFIYMMSDSYLSWVSLQLSSDILLFTDIQRWEHLT